MVIQDSLMDINEITKGMHDSTPLAYTTIQWEYMKVQIIYMTTQRAPNMAIQWACMKVERFYMK